MVGPLSRVDSLVPLQVPGCGEILTTLEARERPLSAVYSLMPLDVVNSEVLATVLAVVWPVR